MPLPTLLCLLIPLQAGGTNEFGRWSGYKAGSWVKVRAEGRTESGTCEMETTMTLFEITRNKAVLQAKVKLTIDGKVLSEVEEKSEVQPGGADQFPIEIQKEGEEEIEVAGKKLKCRWIQGTQNGEKVKYWISGEVPGGIVRGEMTQAGIVGIMKLTALSWEKK